jgi:hypothetical protein
MVETVTAVEMPTYSRRRTVGLGPLCDDKDGNENAGLLTFRNLA